MRPIVFEETKIYVDIAAGDERWSPVASPTITFACPACRASCTGVSFGANA